VIEKPVPTPEKPHIIEKQPEQLKQIKEQPKKVESHLPTTGGKAENPHWYWIGATLVALGSVAQFTRTECVKSKTRNVSNTLN
jgi:hypothetical protein